MRSWTKPTPEQVESAIVRIGDPSIRAYFFGRLNNPLWIDPLLQRGLFQHPRETLSDPETGEVRFPPSPELRYLSRMAAESPNQVTQILLAIPDTDNIMVHYEILTAALNMSPTDATQLLPKILEAAVRRSRHLDYKLYEVLDHFASSGEVDVALLLARDILRLEPPRPIGEEQYGLHTGPISFLGEVYYEMVLSNTIPKIVQKRPLESLRLLLDLVASIVEFDLVQRGSQARDNGLTVSREAIELNAPDWDDDLGQEVISATRDTARRIWADHRECRQALIETLESFTWKIGLRFALDVLTHADPPPLLLLRDRLVLRKNFFDGDIYNEYRRLLRSGFSYLNPSDRLSILTWVDEEANLLISDESFSDREYATRYARNRKREWLSLVSEYLDRERARLFEELCDDSELGPLRAFEDSLVPRSGMWVGPTSPKSADDFNSMSVDEIVAFLAKWKPSGRSMDHSRRGLARALGQMVRNRAQYMSAFAGQFCNVDRTYISEFMLALREAVREGAEISWTSVLELGVSVVTRASISQADESRTLDDASWSECRKSIVQLLESGFTADMYPIPMTLRDLVWKIIKEILNDPEPSPSDEAGYGPPNMDPYTLAINYTRGAAMIANVEYALWIYRSQGIHKDDSAKTNIDNIPEVREVLERNLKSDLDPSIAVRSVYGRYFTQLYGVDPAWCETFVEKIFAVDGDLTALGMVAWQTYLVTNRPHLPVIRLLDAHYRSSVRKLPLTDNGWRHRTPEQALFEHVLLLFVNGHGDLRDDSSLVSIIYRHADPELCGYGNSWLGRGIHSGDQSDDMIARARDLWEWRVEEVKTSFDQKAAVELRSFVWWLRSDRFDVSWIAENLVLVLSLARQIDNEESVLEWLAKNAVDIPTLAIKSVRLLCAETREFWVLDSWIDDIRTVLRVVLDSGDFEATQQAQLLVQALASRGLVSGEEFSVD